MRWKSLKFLLFLGILLFLLGLFAWFWQAEELPFQRASPLAAVGTSQPLLLLLPDTINETTNYPWQESLKRRNTLLDALDLQTTVDWQNWWLLPARGEGGQAVYTFIGKAASGLSAHWTPSSYGPVLPFGGGEIYTFAYTRTEEEMYFARYRNLLLVGRYPFQLEAALRRLNGEEPNWASLPAVEALYHNQPEEISHPELWVYPPALSVDLPSGWISPSALRQWQQWQSLRLQFTAANDSTAYVNWWAVAISSAPYKRSLPWGFIPPDLAAISTVPQIRTSDAPTLDSVWTMRLPLTTREEASIDPDLWIASHVDTTAWNKLRSEAELIDFEDYQTYQLEQWRSFSPLSEWTGRKGVLQAWTVRVEDQLVVALEREVLERWLDFYLLGASLALDAPFSSWLAEEDMPTHALLSWAADTPVAILSLLFPEHRWTAQGLTRIGVQAQKDSNVQGYASIRTDWRVSKGPRLLWTAPLAAAIDWVTPLHRVSNTSEPVGFLLGPAQSAVGQLYSADGKILQLPLPTGIPSGPIYQLPDEDDTRFLLSTTTGLFQLREGEEPDKVPGTIGLAAAAPLQLQGRAYNWEWLYLDQQGGLQIGQSDGQIQANWSLDKDSLTEQYLHWWRGASEELIIVGGKQMDWQAYNKKGSLQWRVPVSEVMAAGPPRVGHRTMDSRLYLPLVDGRIQVLNQGGEHFFLRAGRGPVDHALVGQWWGDERSDIALQRGTLIHLYAYEGTSFAERWQQHLPVVPDTLLHAGKLGLIAVHEATQQLWLLKGNGEVAPGFPITGSQQAQVVRAANGREVLLVISDDELYAYGLTD